MWSYPRSSRLHMRMSKKSSWNHGCDPLSQVLLGKSTHIENRDVVGKFSFSFNGVVQCAIDHTGHLLHACTDRDVYVSDPWQSASDVTLFPCVFAILDCNSPHILLHGSRILSIRVCLWEPLELQIETSCGGKSRHISQSA